MTSRAAVSIGLVLFGVALGVMAWEDSAATSSADERDSAQLLSLSAGREALQASVLQAQAGIELSFDPINRAVLGLRAAAREAELLRQRGPAYREAANHLLQSARALQREEMSIETYKTDLALTRVSSRSFPAAADALSQRVAAGATRSELDKLRSHVERYEDAPTREGAQRLQASISLLETLGVSLDELTRADLDVVLGHARALVGRRERLDRFVRALVASPMRVHIEAARVAYERASRAQSAYVMGMRIAAAELSCAAISLWLLAAWKSVRKR